MNVFVIEFFIFIDVRQKMPDEVVHFFSDSINDGRPLGYFLGKRDKAARYDLVAFSSCSFFLGVDYGVYSENFQIFGYVVDILYSHYGVVGNFYGFLQIVEHFAVGVLRFLQLGQCFVQLGVKSIQLVFDSIAAPVFIGRKNKIEQFPRFQYVVIDLSLDSRQVPGYIRENPGVFAGVFIEV